MQFCEFLGENIIKSTVVRERIDNLEHPTWERFARNVRSICPEVRVLLIVAPPGTGRKRFARDWLKSSGGGEITQLPTNLPRQQRTVRNLFDRLEQDPQYRVAVLGLPSSAMTLLQEHKDAKTVELGELLLTADEFENYAKERAPIADPSVYYQEAGGWLAALDRLLEAPDDKYSVENELKTSLRSWIAAADPEWRAARSVLVPEPRREMLRDLYDELAPSRDELAANGFVIRSVQGTWMTPTLVRVVTTRLMREQDPGIAVFLEERSLAAIADRVHPVAAVEDAISKKSWQALGSLLSSGYWAELYTQNPRFLREVASRFPRWVRRDWLVFNQGVALLESVGETRMELPLPTNEIRYDKDRVARLLHSASMSNARKAGARAYTAGLLEVSVLRLRGHYSEAADAARELRFTLGSAGEEGSSHASLRAFSELHCGIALHIGGMEGEATTAYRAAITLGQISGNHFVLANASANLALLAVLAGDSVEARNWLTVHRSHIQHVGWGKNMVGRTAVLASGFLALIELDSLALQEQLDLLPSAPDTDEFWPVHARLIAESYVQRGAHQTAHGLLGKLKSSRRVAARSPLAIASLALGQVRAELAACRYSDVQQGLAAIGSEGRVLNAWGRALRGETDAARVLATDLSWDNDAGPRMRAAGRNLRLLLDSDRQLNQADLGEVSANFTADGELVDLLPLWQRPGIKSQLIEELTIDEDDITRLEGAYWPNLPTGVPRPRLTAREREILRLLQLGHTRAEIVAKAHLSVNTIKSQTASLYRKLDASSKVEALESANRWGLI